jgi:hypothetical protein
MKRATLLAAGKRLAKLAGAVLPGDIVTVG